MYWTQRLLRPHKQRPAQLVQVLKNKNKSKKKKTNRCIMGRYSAQNDNTVRQREHSVSTDLEGRQPAINGRPMMHCFGELLLGTDGRKILLVIFPGCFWKR